MKKSIDIPEKELMQLIEFTGAKTKNEAINIAISDFNRRKRLAKLANKLGTFNKFMTQKELKLMREDHEWKAL